MGLSLRMIHKQWIILGALFLSLSNIRSADISDSFRVDLGPNSPQIPITCTRGMIIDAGSGGSRLHVYRWSPRVFDTVPAPLSFPTSDEKWTGRMSPAIQTYINDLNGIQGHLEPLIDFAKSVLAGLDSEFHTYPIFFKATGGMRELPQEDRELILNKVRSLLSNKKVCPFYFRNDFARVISGEEEAIYSWCATNLLMGSLLPSSKGQGTVVAPNSTYGTLDLGGSSTQIAFFAPDQDILDGLFKLQIGSQKHWNVYAKSFLEFGINSARTRYLSGIASDYFRNHPKDDFAVVPSTLSYCFHAGYSERISDSIRHKLVEITGPATPAGDQLERCMRSLRPLLFKGDINSYCNTVYNGQCSIADAYQPPLPTGKHSQFVGTSSYVVPWRIMMLPTTATLDEVKIKAQKVCTMNFSDLLKYYEENNLNLGKEKISDQVPYFCFLVSYTLVLLHDGFGFQMNQSLTVLDVVAGNKVSWALGAILYEINSLPWGLKATAKELPWGIIFLSSCIGIVIGAVASFFIAKELFSDPLRFDHEHQLLSDSRSGDSLLSASSSNAHLPSTGGAPTMFGSPALGDKSWVLRIPQFNPFKASEVKLNGSHEASLSDVRNAGISKPVNNFVVPIQLESELTPLTTKSKPQTYV